MRMASDWSYLVTGPVGHDAILALCVRNLQVLTDEDGQAKQLAQHQAVNQHWHRQVLQSEPQLRNNFVFVFFLTSLSQWEIFPCKIWVAAPRGKPAATTRHGIGKSGWGVLTSLGRGPGAAQAPVGCRGNAPCQGVWGPDADAKLSFKG